MQSTLKQRIADYIETHLSEKRKVHTLGVAAEAAVLAERYGADREKAELAALAHDMFRGTDPQTLNRYVRAFGLPSVYLNNANLSHGKIAAKVLERDYRVSDPDLLCAVSFHTTGRAGMSLLEQVIYLADAIEPNRDYPGVEPLRELALVDLDRACLYSFEHTIAFVKERGQYLDPDTEAARNDLAARLETLDGMLDEEQNK